MWYFSSPRIVYGEDALSHLNELSGRRAFIVTDPNILRLGLAAKVQEHLDAAGIETGIFGEVDPDPSLQTAERCATRMVEYGPDWVIGLGGGSSIDTAKAAWLLYERPDADPAAINPFDHYGLRAKARFIAIPTTSGTGAEVTYATVLTDVEEQRKLGLGTYELVPDIAIVDPGLVMGLPPQITADTGMDVLAHAIEGYTSIYQNDFCDGLCLKAAQLVFEYLPRAYRDGSDAEAREHMHNAATIAGLGFGNSMAALAHAMGHALGAVFHVPHGRAVGLFLPYTIQFNACGGDTRYGEIARFLDLPTTTEREGAANLVRAIAELQDELGQPTRVRDLDVSAGAYAKAMSSLIENAESDTQLVMSTRIPDSSELEHLFYNAYEGRPVDF
jgi:alcohol dehydrogenase class IV